MNVRQGFHTSKPKVGGIALKVWFSTNETSTSCKQIAVLVPIQSLPYEDMLQSYKGVHLEGTRRSKL
jgi:hypothetical protein